MGLKNHISFNQDEAELHHFKVLDPGHFHAALVFKRTGYKGISPRVFIYAPVDKDFTDHMARVVPFNNRTDKPAGWLYKIYLGPDFKEAMLDDQSGDIVVISGRNNDKIEQINECISAGLNVLADKPWIIQPEKFTQLESALAEAEKKGLVAYDIMTKRYEITSILQRMLVNHEPVFGSLTEGTPEEPAVVNNSVHHISKIVAGKQLKRPWWFFDTAIQGEGLVDITTHLVDIVFWILYTDKAIDYRKDIEMVSASHWPTVLSAGQYETVTEKPEFPPHFALGENGTYPYYCNGHINFRLKGVNVQTNVIWNYKAPEGTGDTHYSVIKGTRTHVLVLQGAEQNFQPELYLGPAPGTNCDEVDYALTSFISSMTDGRYSGLSVQKENGRWHIDIPQKYRVGHDAHFGQITDRFLEFLDGEPMPSWEKPNMLAKYYVTTQALAMCR